MRAMKRQFNSLHAPFLCRPCLQGGFKRGPDGFAVKLKYYDRVLEGQDLQNIAKGDNTRAVNRIATEGTRTDEDAVRAAAGLQTEGIVVCVS